MFVFYFIGPLTGKTRIRKSLTWLERLNGPSDCCMMIPPAIGEWDAE